MRTILSAAICCLSLMGSQASANTHYDDYCDHVFSDSVEGAVVGGIAAQA